MDFLCFLLLIVSHLLQSSFAVEQAEAYRCEDIYDVAVIGAGLSGLSAARKLSRNGLRTIVLEARDRVGGRVYGRKLRNGGIQEVGAEFIGPTQDRMYALAREFGLKLYDEYNVGDSTLFVNGTKTRYPASPIPPIEAASQAEIGTSLDALNGMAAEIDVHRPWSHPKARQWDNQTYADWLKGVVSLPAANFLHHIATTSIFSAEPSDVSLLYVLTYIAAAGNASTKGTLDRLISTDGGAQQTRVVGGSQLFATELAKRLGRTKLVYRFKANRIERAQNCYRVYSDRYYTCARRIIVAMSPPLANRIKYDPPLPDDRYDLLSGHEMASVGKAIAIYDTPFWRAEGLSGQVLSDVGAGRTTFDNSPQDGSYGALMSFIEADEMRRWDEESEPALRRQVTKDYVNYFGPKAANYTEFIIQRWDLEPFSRGGPVAYTYLGVLEEYGHLYRQSYHGIYWAGTETSDYWIGYMEGAVRSGERAATDILWALGRYR